MADYISQFTGSEIDQRLAKVPQLESGKQDNLVSGSNIKTINGQSVLGSGDMQIQAGDTDAVKYVAQTLTDAQKAQARTNIAAASAAELGQIVTDLTGIEADIDSLEAAVQAIGVGDYVTATTLPTASASTMGHIYLIGPDANNNYDRYFTQESSGSYSWVSLGSTQIDLSTYATQAEVDQLEAEVHNLSGKYYGIFEDAGSLPEGDANGYAFVGTSEPFAIYNFDGEEWFDTGAEATAIYGQPGADGVGLQTVTTIQDGTVVLSLTDGNTITIDLNHNHQQYTKAVICVSVASYEAIADKDSMTFYIIPGVAMYLGGTLVLEQGGTPLPYTPVEYIETDGSAYINTGIKGNDPRSCHFKFSLGSVVASSRCIIGTGSATENASLYVLGYVNASGYFGFGHNYFYANSASSDYLLTAGDPFEAKVAMKNGAQTVQMKNYGASTFATYSKTQSATLTTNKSMYLFAANNGDSTTFGLCPSGSKLYFCKIYSDNSFTTLVFDGIPCVYNGEYGVWDKVSDTFFGNAAASGAFTGPSIQ